jgi:predicted metal-dependent hydrolase
VTHKSRRIADSVRHLEGQGADPRYLGFFELFNRQCFYEAHDVLEDLWLENRHGPDGDFYKGLIQLAGAFVHIQKSRVGPAAALFRLALKHLSKYPEITVGLDNRAAARVIHEGLESLNSDPGRRRDAWPRLSPDSR